jgi:hypothetical protein
MQLGRYYLERLAIGVHHYRAGTKPEDESTIYRQFVLFPELTTVHFPTPATLQLTFASVEDAKKLFRLANTQFKRSLEHFKLDGHVTEHVQMQ